MTVIIFSYAVKQRQEQHFDDLKLKILILYQHHKIILHIDSYQELVLKLIKHEYLFTLTEHQTLNPRGKDETSVSMIIKMCIVWYNTCISIF